MENINIPGAEATTPGMKTHTGTYPADEHTDVLDSNATERTLIRGLLGAPANKVHPVTHSLTSRDFANPAHWIVVCIIGNVAAELIQNGEPGATIPPVRVKDELISTGELNSHPAIWALLPEVVTGTQPGWHDVEKTAEALKMFRLRRALDTYGNQCIEAARGGISDIQNVLCYMPGLKKIATRAGVAQEEPGHRLAMTAGAARRPDGVRTDAPYRAHQLGGKTHA